ncbi:family 78 glycoside hydrolase catalytic domain [Nonomuraea sp. FMUSA5-5]|uniref:alpha-L-rhamnosidase n=1 Tax=Nonomuraea composti TaxID=2720023 RepID=A0ABX1B581_9ACTN|nr:alpha-L-rhamnosidase [Nonomuraea sp. FMUSA5-5]NJP90916.1 family 78 glycoside hydrolase catalytic domain [Nonomuraea sp. FMUSA5-5]
MSSLTRHLPDPWVAAWISPVESEELPDDRPAYLLTGIVTIDGPVADASLHATALGVYEVFVNGTRVGDEELSPGSTNYDETLYAQSHDVTSLLRSGENRIDIVLSDGWYRGRTGSEQRQNSWGTVTAALAQLDYSTSDGRTQVFGTDGTWTCRPSQIVRADLMTGQTTDFSVPLPAALPVRIGLVCPPAPTRSPAPPVRRVEELAPVSATPLAEGVTIVDFGQNIAGWARLTGLGAPGSQTVLEFGEHLDAAGDLTTAHLDTHTPQGEHIPCHQIDRVIAGTGEEVFEPHHTVHGFRYVRVTHPGRAFDPGSITAIVVHTDLRRTGWFGSSDDRLNRLHEAAVWTFRGNAVDVPTDCPTRERLGWTGDFQVFAPTAALLFDIDGFARKWLQAVRDDQYDDGSLAMYSPDPGRMKLSDHPARVGGGSAGWGDAAVAVPWTLYRHYADRDILETSWPSMRAWVEFALRTARERRHPSRTGTPAPHEQYLWDGSFHFGEWLEPKTGPSVDVAEAFRALLAADQGEVGTAYLFRSTGLLADIADVLGREDDAAHYRAVAQRVRAAWHTDYFDGHRGRTASDTQASYVRAIDFGLIPDRLVPRAADRLAELIAQADDHLATGFLSTGSLLPVLADTGHADLAYTLLTQTGVPSWLEMLERGGTTFWENWDGVDGAVASGSLNHYSKGAAMRFLYSHVVGLRQAPGSAGWREFVVTPLPGGGLTHASATLHTVQGVIGAAWTRSGNDLTVTVTVPEGASATALLPGAPPKPLPPGTTTISS